MMDSFSASDFVLNFSDDDIHAPLPKKAPQPTPTVVSSNGGITSLSAPQYAPFSHFFVVVSKGINMYSCAMTPLYLRIRVHPELQTIQSQPAICQTTEANFSCGYMLDFTSIPPFHLGDFIPTIEVYKKLNDEFIGYALLPMHDIKTIKMNGQQLQFLYREDPISIQSWRAPQVIGKLVVTVALGFPCHQEALKPNMSQHITSLLDSSIVQKSSVDKATIQNGVDEIIEEEEEEESDDSRWRKRHRSKHRRHHHHHHTRKEKKYISWEITARQMGWNPPGTNPNWANQASRNGWLAPGTPIIDIIEEPKCSVPTYDVETQYEQPKPEPKQKRVVKEKPAKKRDVSLDDINGLESETDALIHMLNQNNPKRLKPMTIQVSPQLSPQRMHMSIFEKSPDKYDIDADEEDSVSFGDLSYPSGSPTKKLKSYMLSD